MNSKHRMLTCSLALGLSLGTTVAVGQAAESAMPEPTNQPSNGAILSFEQIRQRVETEHPGARVTAIELDDDPWQQVYELEITDNAGAAWELDYDARTGALLKRESDD